MDREAVENHFKVLNDKYQESGKFSDRIKLAEFCAKNGIYLKEPILEEQILVEVESLEAKVEEQRSMLQWCYNFVNKMLQSEERDRIIEELEKLGLN